MLCPLPCNFVSFCVLSLVSFTRVAWPRSAEPTEVDVFDLVAISTASATVVRAVCAGVSRTVKRDIFYNPVSSVLKFITSEWSLKTHS